MLPQRAAYFSDGPTRHHRSGPTPRPRWAVCALLKTRNRLNYLEVQKIIGHTAYGVEQAGAPRAACLVLSHVRCLVLYGALHNLSSSRKNISLCSWRAEMFG